MKEAALNVLAVWPQVQQPVYGRNVYFRYHKAALLKTRHFFPTNLTRHLLFVIFRRRPSSSTVVRPPTQNVEIKMSKRFYDLLINMLYLVFLRDLTFTWSDYHDTACRPSAECCHSEAPQH